MKKIIFIFLALMLVAGIGVIFFGQSNQSNEDQNRSSAQVSSNVEVKDGVQYVTISAKGGYSPKESTAQAGIPTMLIMKTNNTFDCSSAIVIRSIGYQKVLPQTGEEKIDLGSPRPGTLEGLCSMGMYRFAVHFEQ